MDGLLAAKENGKRQWMYPLVRKGRFYKWRSWLSYFYLIFFFAGPFLRINGQPLLLLNVIDRQFVLLGQVFWPQDIFLFMLASLVFLVCVVIFTIAFGRIFCGWICPQTIFMEMVFRKIEIWIEGDANKRKKLDAGAWTREKIIKNFATVQDTAVTWRRRPFVLDHIFHNPALRCVGHQVRPTPASDHPVLVADFEFV